MIYLLYGTDTKKSREKLRSLIEALLSKKPDAMLIRVNSETFAPEMIDEYVEGQGLFEQRSIIVFDTVCELAMWKEVLEKRLKDMGHSDNVFIFIEGKLDAKMKKVFEKYAEKVQEFERTATKEKKQDFNIFALSDALGERDRKRLWVIYQEGKLHNVSDEEMHGILFWGTKNMLLVKDAKNAKECGLSPFVFGKAKGHAKNYSQKELGELSTKLVTLYHEARRGEAPLDVALERLILSAN